MSDAFDPYYSWLGIPPAQQPADYYRLLGINRFEGNQEVIANAAERQIRHIETFKTGLHAKEAEKLLNKLATAKACLSDVGKKQVYDRAMSGTVAAENSPSVASDALKAHSSKKVATSRSRPRTRNPLVELAKIVLGGIAELVIGMAILWYGFGMDVLGVMQPPRDVTANPLKQSNVKAPPKAESHAVKSLDESTGAKPIVPKPKSKTEVVQPRTTNQAQPSAHWQILTPTTLEALHETKLSMSEDSSVLASGFSAATNTYVLAAASPLAEITGFQIEALPDSSLPGGGPGRCGGNFVVTEFKVFTIGSDGEALPIALRNGSASYEQEDSLGNIFSAARAIDGDEHGKYYGWSLVPGLGKPHRMVVETVEPISGSEMKLRIVLDQQHGAQHTLGRFRLAVTSSPPPFHAGEDVKSLPGAPLNDSGSPPDATVPPNAEPEPAGQQQAQADRHENSASAAATPEDVNVAPVRLTVPSPDSLAAAEKVVRSVFADEYASAKQPAEKSNLAAKLLQVGLDTTDDTASRFVTLRSARNVAVEGGDVDLAFRAVDAMNESFEMDTLAEQARVAEDLAMASLNDDETAKLRVRVGELREQAFDRDVYSVAVSLNNLSRGLGKGTDKQWREATDRWTKRLESGSAAFELVQEALKTLESSPEDAAANLTIGRYRCLLKGEWQIGLPYLAKGSDEKLRAIAEREMASSDPTPSETLALADSWWDLAAELGEIEQPQVQMRAAQLYESALPNLSGLSGAKADKRLRELRALGIDSNAVLPELPRPGPARTDDGSKNDFKVMSNSIGMKLVLIPAGEFMMGSGSSAETLAALFDTPPSAFSAEYPRHQVRISKAFYAGKYEVTVEQFRQFVEASGYQTYNEVHPEGGILYDRKQQKQVRVKGVSWRNTGFEQTDAHPVVSVTWDDAVAFCDWLSLKEGARYRMPTEAEWEYVSRAATDTIYYSGNSIEDLRGCCNAAGLEVPVLSSDRGPLVSRVPWTDGFSYNSPVGSFRPNGFGLYDITGNAWEWCRDSLREYLPKSIAVDPIGPVSGETRVVRGGSHADAAFGLRVTRRAAPPRDLGEVNIGFRVVRELDITP